MESKTRIKWFDSLDSTNDELLRHLPSYDNLSVVAAVEQFAGRGQRGNRWLSEPGDNLTFSLLIRHPGLDRESIPAREVMSVTFLSTLVVRDWLREKGVEAVIKWPNDIYVNNRKICGMLVENGLDGAFVAWSAVGIGINLNQTAFPGELVNPTSLKRLTGKDFGLKESLEEICSLFEERLPDLYARPDQLHAAYCDGLFQAGIPRPYRDLRSGEEFTGTIKGVTREGRLLMDRDGTQVSYAFKEVGYIL